jgi:hypothetical protein
LKEIEEDRQLAVRLGATTVSETMRGVSGKEGFYQYMFIYLFIDNKKSDTSQNKSTNSSGIKLID